MNATDLVISTQGLSKSFGQVHALKSLSLQVPDKSIFAFLGPNGAGKKTTTIKLLLGLIRPTAGGGTIFGQDFVRDSVDIRANVGYLPQDARFYEHMTARQTLDYTAKFFKGPQAEIDKRVDEMIELVGLTGKADRPIKGFSGSERQRLGIAQAEINYPDLLILDEPAASLNPQGRRDVLAVMSRIRKYATIFYCTHILDDVQRVSDQVAILNQGELVAQAPIEELLAGTGDVVFSVTLRGDAGSAYARVKEQAWVSGIEVSQRGDQTVWQVSVTDTAAAEDQLLGLIMAGGGVRVADFGRKEYALEDVFLSIVERSLADGPLLMLRKEAKQPHPQVYQSPGLVHTAKPATGIDCTHGHQLGMSLGCGQRLVVPLDKIVEHPSRREGAGAADTLFLHQAQQGFQRDVGFALGPETKNGVNIYYLSIHCFPLEHFIWLP